MRFLINFIFFGILFYLIYLFFPEAFATLVSWANHVYVFFRDLILMLVDKFQSSETPPKEQVMLPLSSLYRLFF